MQGKGGEDKGGENSLVEDLKQELKKVKMELEEKNEDVEDLKDEVKKQKKLNAEMQEKHS